MRYYFQGCVSWGWFYPFHFSPFAYDLTTIPFLFPTSIEDQKEEDNEQKEGENDKEAIYFELGSPFSPLEQLLAVLPPLSSHALPDVLSDLMTSPDSPILHFYPKDVNPLIG